MRKDQDAAPRDITGDPGRSGTPGRTHRGGVLGEVEPPAAQNGNPGVPTAPRIVGTGISRRIAQSTYLGCAKTRR